MAVQAHAFAGSESPGGGRPPLPAEVLAAPVDGGAVFIDRMDEWRRGLDWTHARFAAHLGISRNYWWLLRSHQRELTIGVAQRVLRERPEFEYFLGSWVRERSWGHRPPGGDGVPGGGAPLEGH